MDALIANRVIALVGAGFTIMPQEQSNGPEIKRAFTIVDSDNAEVAYFPECVRLYDVTENDIPGDFFVKVFEATE